MESIKTLVADEGWQLMKAGVSQRLVDIHSQLEIYDNEGVYRSVSEMRKNVKFSNEDIEKIVNLGWIRPQPEGISIHKSKDIWVIPRNDEDED